MAKDQKRRGKRKRVRVHKHSYLAYGKLVERGQTEKESDLLHRTLKTLNKSLSRRQLHHITGLELGALCRVLKNAENAKTVIVTHTAECEFTGMTVNFYALAPEKEAEVTSPAA